MPKSKQRPKLPRYTPKLFIRGRLNDSDAFYKYVLKYPDSELAKQYDAYFHERDRLKRKARQGDIKLQALGQYSYGNEIKCVRCGFSNPDALVLHGAKVEGKHGIDLYVYLKSKGWPRGYEVLCQNCVFITSGRGHDYALKEEVLQHYSKVKTLKIMNAEASSPSVRIAPLMKYVCAKCGFTIFVLSTATCPKCGTSMREKARCVKCGFTDLRALSLDHIGAGGNKHKEELEREYGITKVSQFYGWLKDNGYPQEPPLQVLCMNCQWIKASQFGEW